MYYVTWGWHIKSPYATATIEPLMRLCAPRRLSLLFFISGAAIQALLRRQGARAGFIAQRSKRLLWPLQFGMLVVVPPQAYYEVVTKLAYAGNYADFMRLYVTGYHGFCRNADCLALPTWNHLWLLPYLWVYSLVAWAFARWMPAALDALAARLRRWGTVAASAPAHPAADVGAQPGRLVSLHPQPELGLVQPRPVPGRLPAGSAAGVRRH